MNVVKRGQTRVWLIDGGASPTNTPVLLAWAAAGSPEKSFGDVTRIEVPSSVKRGAYDVADTFQSGEENATLGITLRETLEPSLMFKVANKKCVLDVQIHAGACTDPRDYNHGWETGKIKVFEDARITTHSASDYGSLSSDDEGEVDEEVEISASQYYEIGPMTFGEKAASEVGQEIIKVVVCDTASCGDCEDPSDGCQRVFAISAPVGTSPGLLAEVLVSLDGLDTIYQESPITSLSAAENPNDADCVGDYLVVVSEDSNSLHYASIDDLVTNAETWVEVATGFVALKGPLAIDSISPFDTWIVGEGGYIYFTTDPTGGVEVQSAGTVTTEDLNDIDAYSTEIAVAVGNNNAVVFTTNGASWSTVTGPAVGVNLISVSIRSEKEWWIGTDDGKKWYTRNQGTSWTEKTFPSSGTGIVKDLIWASKSVGFSLHNIAGRGFILRTISGGNTWYRLPDGSSTMVDNDKLNSLAVCEMDVNTLFAGGLHTNAADGILLKGSTSYV